MSQVKHINTYLALLNQNVRPQKPDPQPIDISNPASLYVGIHIARTHPSFKFHHGICVQPHPTNPVESIVVDLTATGPDEGTVLPGRIRKTTLGDFLANRDGNGNLDQCYTVEYENDSLAARYEAASTAVRLWEEFEAGRLPGFKWRLEDWTCRDFVIWCRTGTNKGC